MTPDNPRLHDERTPGHNLVEILLQEHQDLARRAARLRCRQDAAGQAETTELLQRLSDHRRTTIDQVDPLIRRYVPQGTLRADGQLASLGALERLAFQIRSEGAPWTGCEIIVRALLVELQQHLNHQWWVVMPLMLALNDLGQSCSPKFPTWWRWSA